MAKQIILFAACAFNLAETSRMVEIAKGVERHPEASRAFEIHFISDGGEFEGLIENHGFPLTRLEPRLTKEKIEHIARVDRGEKFAPQACTVSKPLYYLSRRYYPQSEHKNTTAQRIVLSVWVSVIRDYRFSSTSIMSMAWPLRFSGKWLPAGE